jgi:hypothetical protein
MSPASHSFLKLHPLESNCTERRWFFIRVKKSLSKLMGYSKELGLDLSKPEDRFKWFLASVLLAKRVSAETAEEGPPAILLIMAQGGGT